MDLQLAGRTYLITGGTRGLGRATAEVLVASGADVVVSGRTAESAAAAADQLTNGGPGRAVGVGVDNADPAAPQQLLAAAQGLAPLRGALISVGGPTAGALTDITDEQWRDSFDRVFLGALRIARAVVSVLHNQPPVDGERGAIAFVLSSTVVQPAPTLAISNGLRPGLAMIAKEMADELGPQGIRVNSLLPGSIETDRVREVAAAAADPAAARRAAEQSVPLRRYGRPAEFGAAAAFLLSPVAGYLTGVALPVDGGVSR